MAESSKLLDPINPCFFMQWQQTIPQFFDTLRALPEAWRLIRDRQLWRGVDQYGWVTKVLIIAAILLGLSFIGLVIDWVRQLGQADSALMAISSMGSLAGSVAMEGYESFTSGLMKYVVLLLSEVLIFHFMQRSLEELHDKPIATDFKAFYHAQVRMIKVTIRIWIFELIVTIGLSIFFGIFGFLGWLEGTVTFLAQCFFFGLLILDNYSEQFGLSIKESIQFNQQFPGIALALGMVLYILMLVPLVGVVAGTILVSVTAVIVMGAWSDTAFLEKEKMTAE